jgi:dTDP-4-amino-4,6-dideoxygalactose transaminase
VSDIPKLRISPLPFEDKIIVDAFQANQLVTGPHIGIFEKGLAACFNYTYANTTSSGFAALFLALKSLKLKNAKVVVPGVSTCQAITNAVLANGFEVVFCEIAPNHLSLAEDALAALFRENQIDVIIAPSHFGIPAPIETYKKYGVPVIEDACQAFFTRTIIQSAADIMVLSFYPTKQFNCIEGGAVLHNSLDQNQRIEDLRYYESQIGFDGQARYNLRMANLHAAFGCLLMEQLAEERSSLIKIRDSYISGVHRKNLLVAAQCEAGVIPWRFLIKSKDQSLLDSLITANIQSDIELASLVGTTDSEIWFSHFRSIPYYSELPEFEQKFVIDEINNIFHSVKEL